MHTLALLTGWPGWTELLIVCVVALLLFGRRLPEVGRSLGRGIVEFKKGLKGVKKDVDEAVEGAQDIADEAAKPADDVQ